MKMFFLGLVLVPFAASTSTNSHLRNKFNQQVRRLDSCGYPFPPNVQESPIVELSYYPPGSSIAIDVVNNNPNRVFKFYGCPGGTKFTFNTCYINPAGLDTLMTWWNRDYLNFVLEECQDDDSDCGWREIVVHPTDMQYYNEELYFKPSLYGALPSGTLNFNYSVTDLNPVPGFEWPNCFPSVTATFVKGTYLNLTTGADPNIVFTFLYTGTFASPIFQAVVFEDTTCTVGNEVAWSDHGGINPPFDVTLAANNPLNPIPMFSGTDGFYNTKVNLKANYANWNLPIWDGNWTTYKGKLQFCTQFQVLNAANYTLEFVDVLLTAEVEKLQNCTEEDCHGSVKLIRDEIIVVNKTHTPYVPCQIGDCKNGTIQAVAQGEPFDVCIWLVNPDPGVCIKNVTKLYFEVSVSGVTYTYEIVPTLAAQLLAGPVICQGTKCWVKVLPPADLIRQLVAGYPNATAGVTYLMGYFKGTLHIGRGNECTRRRLLNELESTEEIAFEGKMELEFKAPPDTPVPARTGLFRKVMLRLKNLLKKLLSRRNK